MLKLTELIYFLASLYNTPDEIRGILRQAGFDNSLPFIPFNNKATVFWTNIIFHLKDKNGALDKLIVGVLNDGNQENDYLKAILVDKNTDFKSPYFKTTIDKPINPTSKQLEKLTREVNTLLPIRFLEEGIIKSKSVVRITTDTSSGSGFIVKNKHLITNNHVISDIRTAESAKIQLNYQEDLKGVKMPYIEKSLDPFADKGLETSAKNDWTVVKLKDYSDEDEKSFGSIELKEVTLKIDDFVNIIQHPGGKTKKIALYHNMVIGCDDERVQYLTDTDRGSSGSPVFNSNWEVVALHHAGGELKVIGTNKNELVNEGININLVIKEIRGCGIYI